MRLSDGRVFSKNKMLDILFYFDHKYLIMTRSTLAILVKSVTELAVGQSGRPV
jgi:hypothetical protein